MKKYVFSIQLILVLFFPLSTFAQKATITFPNGIKLHFYESKFDSSNHTIQKIKIFNWTGIGLIDGKPIFGTDWEMPKLKMDSAFVEIKNKRIPLNVSNMYNPWFRNIEKENFKIEKCEGGYIFTGLFSDAAGAYLVQWKVISNSSVRTIITHDDRIIYTLYPH